MAQKKPRGKRGLGTLYKRDVEGNDHPATSKKKGNFWLKYTENGKRFRVPLEINGEPVQDIATARTEQLRIRAPYLTGDKIEVIKRMKAELTELEVQEEIQLDRANPPLKIDDAWNEYRSSANRPNSGPETLKNYLGHWNAFRTWLKDQKKGYIFLRDITEADAGAFMAYLRDARNASGNTYNKHLQFLRTFCTVLKRPARLENNPFNDIKRLSQVPNSRRELTIDELHKILSTAKGNLKLLLLLGTCTGLRLGDCCTLLWEEIDLQTGVIRRIPRKTQRSKKAMIIGIPHLLNQGLIAIPEEQRNGLILPEIAKLYNDRSKTQSKISKLIQGHIRSCGIATHDPGTGAKYHYEGKRKVYDKTSRAIVRVGFHSLRHTWVSIHAMSGTPQAIIQDSVGHSNPAMTAHYTHTSSEVARQISSVLDLPQLSDVIDAEIITEETEPVPAPSQREQLLQALEGLSTEEIQKFMTLVSEDKQSAEQ